MLKKIILPCLLVSSVVFSQKSIDPTPEDIALATELKTKYEDDDVVVLNSNEIISFEINNKTNKVITTHKINEEIMNIGFRSDIQKYVIYDNESNVNYISVKYRNKKFAYFKLIDEAISDDGLFHHDARVKYKNVDFPVKGYKYFFETKKEINDIKYFTSIYLSNEYAIENKKIKIIIPSWLQLELKELNFGDLDIKKTESIDEKSGDKTITYEIKNLKGKFKETQSPGPSYIYPHILFLAKSFTYNKETEVLFNETKDLYKWYKSLVDSMEEHPEELKEEVARLTENATTDEEKIKSIYYWVQDNIRYIAFEDGIAGFKPDESQNVYNKRYGDCKGMANLTRQMLKEAGFDARFTWIGTKRLAYDYSTPSLIVDNHMICTVFIDGKKVYLDGTEKYNSYGEYAERIQGKQVLIENGDTFLLENIPVADAIKNKETYIFNAQIMDDALVGDVDKTFDGESRSYFLSYLNLLNNDNKDEVIKSYLDNDNKNLQVKDIVTSNLENRDGTLSISCHLTQKNMVSSFDEEIYIDLDTKKDFEKFIFKDRQTDYLFSFKKYLTSIINLEIPTGYKIQNIPESILIDTEYFKIDVSFSQTGNTLTYSKTFIIKKAILKKENFIEWNETIKKLKSIYNQQLILTK